MVVTALDLLSWTLLAGVGPSYLSADFPNKDVWSAWVLFFSFLPPNKLVLGTSLLKSPNKLLDINWAYEPKRLLDPLSEDLF